EPDNRRESAPARWGAPSSLSLASGLVGSRDCTILFGRPARRQTALRHSIPTASHHPAAPAAVLTRPPGGRPFAECAGSARKEYPLNSYGLHGRSLDCPVP